MFNRKMTLYYGALEVTSYGGGTMYRVLNAATGRGFMVQDEEAAQFKDEVLNFEDERAVVRSYYNNGWDELEE